MFSYKYDIQLARCLKKRRSFDAGVGRGNSSRDNTGSWAKYNENWVKNTHNLFLIKNRKSNLK